MADIEKIVSIIFFGKDDVSKTAKSIASNMNKLEEGIQDVAAPFAALGDQVVKVDAILAGLVAGTLALAVKTAGDFGDQFAEITTLIDDTGESIDAFRESIIDYGQDSKKSYDDINAAIYSAISAGIDYKDALGTLTDAEKLSIAGKADLESTIKLLASTLNAYGESTDQAAKYSDVFFTTVKKGQTTLPELANGLAQVTGIASSGQVPIETLSAAIAALTAAGAPTSQAITQVKSAIQGIIKPSSDAQKTAAALGIEFGAAALKTKGLEGVLWEAYQATDGNVEIMAKLFGRVEGLNAALVLGSDTTGKFRDSLDAMRNAAGATEAAYQKMAENFSLTNQNLLNNVQATLIKLGQNMQGEYADIVGGLGAVFKSIGTAVDAGAFDPFFALLSDFAGKAQGLLGQVAENIPEALEDIDYSGIIEALKDLGGEIEEFFDGFDPSDPEQLAQAIQKVVDWIAALITVTSGMVEALKPVLNGIISTIEGFSQLDEESQKQFGNLLGAAQAVVKAGALITGVLVLIGGHAQEIKQIFQVVIGSIQAGWNTLQVAFDTAAYYVIEFVKNINKSIALISWGDLDKKAKENIASLEAWQEAIKVDSAKQMAEAVDGISQAMSGLTGSAKEASSEAENIGKAIGDIPDEKNVGLSLSETSEAADLIDWSKDPDIQKIVQTTVDGSGLDKVTQDISGSLDTVSSVDVKPGIDPASLDKAKEDLKEVTGEDAIKKIEIQAKVQIAEIEAETKKIEALAETMQTSFEWKAKLDIAEVEANAKIVESAFGSITAGIESTGDTLLGLFGALDKSDLGLQQVWALQDAIEQEIKNRQIEFELQKKLTEAQIALAEKKAALLAQGEPLITVQADGLKPHLEMILWEILEQIQIKASETYDEFLLGIGAS